MLNQRQVLGHSPHPMFSPFPNGMLEWQFPIQNKNKTFGSVRKLNFHAIQSLKFKSGIAVTPVIENNHLIGIKTKFKGPYQDSQLPKSRLHNVPQRSWSFSLSTNFISSATTFLTPPFRVKPTGFKLILPCLRIVL